jgi:capsular exopolysaccharide synthesis family protein
MAQTATEVVPELTKFDDSDAQAPVNGKQKTVKGLSADDVLLEQPIRHLQPQRTLVRPSREIELTLARLDPHLVAIHELDPHAVSQFSRLAISLISGAARRVLKRVMLTSAHHGEGRTCVTLNLAAALARARQRVLVVDTDLRRPSVCRLLGVESEVGLAEAMALGLPAEEAIVRILPADFHILPTRGQVENSAELLASNNFKRLMAELDPCYDFMLFDSAPLLTSADASLLGMVTNATLMVVRPGATSTSEMSKSISLLNEETFFGVVLNRVND